jgi:PhoPQ-activated pathogenicity-related protein
MIINGANDPYWTVDSLNLYWDGLKNDKWVVYVPNAGHDLTQKHANGSKDRDRAINTLVAFAKHIVKDNPMPKLEWKHEDFRGGGMLTVKSNVPPRGARTWSATAPTRDFRQATWAANTVNIDDGVAIARVPPPTKGYRAFFVELDFEIDGIAHPLSTQIRVLEGDSKQE